MGWQPGDPPEDVRPAAWFAVLKGLPPVVLTGAEWGILCCMFDSAAKLANLEGVLPPALSGRALWRVLEGSKRDVPLGVFEGRLLDPGDDA
ncbi:MAG TPA: hypothetical protein DCP69_12960 [Candidatus Omnitrophica bacterium]|nr:hypothetical protein [Candidatus Omnitrophota bacterium]